MTKCPIVSEKAAQIYPDLLEPLSQIQLPPNHYLTVALGGSLTLQLLCLVIPLLEQHFDFRLAGIIKQFNLRFLPALIKGGFYKKLATYGHVGRTDLGLVPWMDEYACGFTTEKPPPSLPYSREACPTLSLNIFVS